MKLIRLPENQKIHLYQGCKRRGYSAGALKIIEGTVSNVPPQGGRKHPNQEFIQINTKNILFICGGAFDGLENQF